MTFLVLTFRVFIIMENGRYFGVWVGVGGWEEKERGAETCC